MGYEAISWEKGHVINYSNSFTSFSLLFSFFPSFFILEPLIRNPTGDTSYRHLCSFSYNVQMPKQNLIIRTKVLFFLKIFLYLHFWKFSLIITKSFKQIFDLLARRVVAFVEFVCAYPLVVTNLRLYHFIARLQLLFIWQATKPKFKKSLRFSLNKRLEIFFCRTK